MDDVHSTRKMEFCMAYHTKYSAPSMDFRGLTPVEGLAALRFLSTIGVSLEGITHINGRPANGEAAVNGGRQLLIIDGDYIDSDDDENLYSSKSNKPSVNIAHWKGTYTPTRTAYYFDRLINEVPWKIQKWVTGRNLPRMVFRYDNPQRELLSAESRNDAIGVENEQVDIIETLIKDCEFLFKCSVIGVWCNYYRDGKDWTPPHQDSYGHPVFTFSFGATRRCVFEGIGDSSSIKDVYILEDGDIFFFTPMYDATHKHSIPKSNAKNIGPRISIVMFTTTPIIPIDGPMCLDDDGYVVLKFKKMT